jgi:integrase/recombinase XerD
MLPTISLCPVHHRGQKSIAISSKLSKDLELEVRKIKAIKWCGEKSCWYLPLTKENYLKIKSIKSIQQVYQNRTSFNKLLSKILIIN